MAAVFLVTLYEYSPLFYISVVSLCFVVTAAMVLGWFGFDVPVILRSSDETESLLPTPEKQMVQTTNPFSMRMGSGPASVTDGVTVKPCCLEPCVLSCFWGCEVSALQGALQAHQHGLLLSTPQHFQEALHLRYHHCQSFHVDSEDSLDLHTQIPAEQGVTDFGPLPRDRYPLVAVLTLAEPDARETYNIVANVTVLHVPDDKYRLSARTLFQYLLTSTGNMYELKPLFMSADSRGASEPPESEQSVQPSEAEAEASKAEQSPGLEEQEQEEEEDWSEGQGRDCVVCQNAAVNRVLLPCRHACVCDSCVSHFQHCPICRAFVQESFSLHPGPGPAAPH
ncbi:LOW QUALITY PROTEIN: cell growth regulator with RING finger domain protein 1 [Plectropomus leopardus]|uniref:LOW QUALITY PROTEIN: cell growth regulator with RING finger domain protein 1 n=1 Tax=Plectropomus leopardus TaxID=160734 RepID=UPI001C4BAD94|nr:LOW QUALITY PROTEIN: cell growth regulator with RING finger domain protein 1 [Plectropomus leopardus]